MYPSFATAPNGSTVHFARSTPTTSMCATSSSAFDGSGNAELVSRATSALRPGWSGSSSALIPSFCKIPAMYFAAASSFPGGFVVLILISSVSHPVASRARADVSPACPLVCATAGGAMPGTCALADTAQSAMHSVQSTDFLALRMHVTVLSPLFVSWGTGTAHLGGRLANVFHRICFILTCHQRAPGRCNRCAFLSSTVGYWRAARGVHWGME